MSDGAQEKGASRGTTMASKAVFFRKAFLAEEMYVVRQGDAPRFDGVGEYAVSVSVTNIDRWIRSPSSRCTGTVRREMPRGCFALYEALWSRRLPDGISAQDLLLHGQATKARAIQSSSSGARRPF